MTFRLGSAVALAILLLPSLTHGAEPGPLRVVFVGDIMLDGGPGHAVTNGGDPFAHVAAVLRDADLTIGNLECAIVKEGHAVDKPYTFRGPKRALPLLKQYFSAVSLANNHTGDWGPRSFPTGLELLRDEQLPFFGAGLDERQARKPLILEAAGRKVALLGYNDIPPESFRAGKRTPGVAWLVKDAVVQDIRAARGRADLVLLFLHWGEELEETPDAEQQALARAFIDAGADAVIGGHAHVTQTIEWYKDRPIVYSLGNFVFDYFPYDPPIWKGWIARLTFAAQPLPRLEIIPVELDPAGLPHLVATPEASASPDAGPAEAAGH